MQEAVESWRVDAMKRMLEHGHAQMMYAGGSPGSSMYPVPGMPPAAGFNPLASQLFHAATARQAHAVASEENGIGYNAQEAHLALWQEYARQQQAKALGVRSPV